MSKSTTWCRSYYDAEKSGFLVLIYYYESFKSEYENLKKADFRLFFIAVLVGEKPVCEKLLNSLIQMIYDPILFTHCTNR